MTGRIFDTYAAAIQHDLVDLPSDAERLGVVRRPTPWFHGVIDRNEPALGPPDELLTAVKARSAELQDEGRSDPAAHNQAMDEVDYDARYLDHLASDESAQAALFALREQLQAGTDVVLVCYENTDQKRCHRTLLRERLEQD